MAHSLAAHVVVVVVGTRSSPPVRSVVALFVRQQTLSSNVAAVCTSSRAHCVKKRTDHQPRTVLHTRAPSPLLAVLDLLSCVKVNVVATRGEAKIARRNRRYACSVWLVRDFCFLFISFFLLLSAVLGSFSRPIFLHRLRDLRAVICTDREWRSNISDRRWLAELLLLISVFSCL